MCDCLQNWGSISDQITQIQEFLESLEKFVSVLSGANSSLQGRVELSDHDHSTLLDSLKTPADYVMAGTLKTSFQDTSNGPWAWSFY